MDNSERLIQDSVLSICYPVRHIHVILMICMEATDLPQRGASRGHVRANEMREWCAGQRQTPIGATQHPVKLIWKPMGPPVFEYWPGRTSHGAYPLVFIRGNESFQPVGSGSSVVVEKGEHLSARELGPSIARRAKAAVVFICQNDYWHRPRSAAFPEVFFALPQQLLIMIDADNDLDRR